MISQVKTIKEHHPNGSIWVIEKRAIIDKLYFDEYKNNKTFILNENIGSIRLEYTKYFDNGQLAWSLKYNENGTQINKYDPSYRKDGTVILY